MLVRHEHCARQGDGKDSLRQGCCPDSFLHLLSLLIFFLALSRVPGCSWADKCLLNEIKDTLVFSKNRTERALFYKKKRSKRNYFSTCIYPVFECIRKARAGSYVCILSPQPRVWVCSGLHWDPTQTPLPSRYTHLPPPGSLGPHSSRCPWPDESHPLTPSDGCILASFILLFYPTILIVL